MLILNKDVIEFVTQFLCLLGHPVVKKNFFHARSAINTGWVKKNRIIDVLDKLDNSYWNQKKSYIESKVKMVGLYFQKQGIFYRAF